MVYSELKQSDISYLANDEDSVARFNDEFRLSWWYDCFIFMKDGSVYACEYSEPCSFDKVERIK